MESSIKYNRVLHLIYSLNAGGIESFVMNVLRNVDTEKIKFDFIVIRDRGIEQFYDEEVGKYGGRIIEVGSYDSKKTIKYIKTRLDIYRYLRSTDYRVIHVHSGQIDKLPDSVIARLLRVPNLILHAHNQGVAKSVRFYGARLILHKMFRFLYTIIPTEYYACSKAAASWTYLPVMNRKNKIKIINNGIDTAKFLFHEDVRRQYREKYSCKDKFVIGHIGRFEYQKNHDFLIDIFYEIQKRHSKSILILLGVGPLQEEIRKKVERLNIEDKVLFLGVTHDVAELLSAMDVFVFPSHFEGLPVVGVEVQAASLMTVASNTITEEVAITEYWNYKSLKSSAREWADEILKYKNGYPRVDVSEKIVDAGFDIHAIAKKLEFAYLKMMERR